MSVKKRPRDGSWFYRFNYKKETYQDYGFESHDKAKDAEIQCWANIKAGVAKRKKIDSNELSIRDAAQIFYDEYASHLDNWATYRPRLAIIVECFKGLRLIDLQRTDAMKLIHYVKENVTTRYREADKTIDKPITEQTARHYYSGLKALLNWWIHEKGFAIVNPFLRIKLDPIPKAKVRFLYPAEEKLLTPVLEKDTKIFPYYFTALETGLRENNLCHIRIKDVDFIIRRIFIPLSKNGRSGYIPISDRLLPFLLILAQGKKPDDYILGTYTRHTVSKKFKEAAISVGLADIDFHTTRHTFAYNLLSQGIPLYVVSKLLLHSHEKVTEDHYGHLAQSDLSRAVNTTRGYVLSVTPKVTPIEPAERRLDTRAIETQ